MSASASALDRLRPIGFNALLAQAGAAAGLEPDELQRIIEMQREHCVIHDGLLARTARILPALARQCMEENLPPAVGDWVHAQANKQSEWWIDRRLPSYSELHRIDSSGRRQALVSNVDLALLVMGLDGDFNPRRLERYLALTRSGGVWPVVVLTKADLCGNLDQQIDTLRERLPADVMLHAVNATVAASANVLMSHLGAGQTGVLLGSSGAGKSTLMNTLSGAELQSTGAVREQDSRGRHTTTARVLRSLPNGACLIDTPGLRGLRLDADEAALDEVFHDITELARDCRFRDCAHENEPGCAVVPALSPDRLTNYHKLRREFARERANPLAKQATKAQVKERQRALRAFQRSRGR